MLEPFTFENEGDFLPNDCNTSQKTRIFNKTAVITSTSTLPLKIPYDFATSPFMLHVCQPHSATPGRQVIPSAVLRSFPQWVRTGNQNGAQARLRRLAAHYLLISLPFDAVYSLSQPRMSNTWHAGRAHTHGSLAGLLAKNVARKSVEMFWVTKCSS